MIGWYVHDHGSGHLMRLRCIARHLTSEVTVLSSLPRPADWEQDWIQLDPDVTASPSDATAGGTLHWAPLHHAGLLSRGAAITEWAARTRPKLMVVDVSVEVSVQVRLLGIPVVVAGMRGRRDDRAHVMAYDLAEALLCPWPAALPEASWPARWHEKAWCVGGLSRFDGTEPSPPHPGRVAVLWGAGGGDVATEAITAAIAQTPPWTWEVVQESTAAGVARALSEAEVVVTHAGQNALAEVAALRRAAVVLPQQRPYSEQHASADALRDGGIAVVRESWPSDWPEVLKQARLLGGSRWALWSDGHGAERAAGLLDERAGSACARP